EEKAAIISEAKPEPYAVLPGGYGLSKLVHDGVLQAIPNGNTVSVVRYKSGALTTLIGVEKVTFTGGRQGDMLVLDAKDFKIVRKMPYFPRHLSSLLHGVFILAAGVEAPAGEAPVCLISDETGKPPQEGTRCPRLPRKN